jgi:hypothetical protein
MVELTVGQLVDKMVHSTVATKVAMSVGWLAVRTVEMMVVMMVA